MAGETVPFPLPGGPMRMTTLRGCLDEDMIWLVFWFWEMEMVEIMESYGLRDRALNYLNFEFVGLF